MAHLTLGELTRHQQILGDPRDAGRRLAQIRRRPGYGATMLKQYQDVLPRGVLAAEMDRLDAISDRATRGDPVTFALVKLRRAYEKDDIRAIRRWQRAVTTAGGRGYLQAMKRRNASYRARGISGLG